MRVIPQSATLVAHTPEPELLIEKAGRVCYKSEGKAFPGSHEAFIRMLKLRGHLSVLEHASATFHIVCDRGVSHELVRHRLASFSQESTRYVDYKEGLQVIAPPGLEGEAMVAWIDACRWAEVTYQNMREAGCSKEIARSVLPTCLKTELWVTANFREWLHILALRTAPAAHPQMREVMELVKYGLRGIAPNVFGGES